VFEECFFHSDVGWPKYSVLYDGEQVLINYQDPHFVDLLQVSDGGDDATEEEVMEVIDKHQQQRFLQSYSPVTKISAAASAIPKTPTKRKIAPTESRVSTVS
jgi:hypothetical protein